MQVRLKKSYFPRITILITILLITLLIFSCESDGQPRDPITKIPTELPAPDDKVEPNNPFPQGLSFEGCIKPDDVSQEDMDTAILDYFNTWIDQYVKGSNGGTRGGGFYIEMQGTGGSSSDITTSEAHGYGMMIFALMAGGIPNAKSYFDGMYNMYDKHRSTTNKHLMSWVINETESIYDDDNSAADGDIDIAYALLLAHDQWGSDGKINYLEEAKRMITMGIKEGDMSKKTKRVQLGDWDKKPLTTRSSDWITDHFSAYYRVTGDEFWKEVNNEIYNNLIPTITEKYSPETGLMPDFITGQPPEPANPNFLETENDGNYYWNACRFPWRMAVDYAHNGTPEAKAACKKISDWITATFPEAFEITVGFELDGTPIEEYNSMAFTAPFVTACIVDAEYQTFLNGGWYDMHFSYDDYYADTINLLCMLLVSGNWWSPAQM